MAGSPRELGESASGRKPAEHQKSRPPHSSSKPAGSSVYFCAAAAGDCGLELTQHRGGRPRMDFQRHADVKAVGTELGVSALSGTCLLSVSFW